MPPFSEIFDAVFIHDDDAQSVLDDLLKEQSDDGAYFLGQLHELANLLGDLPKKIYLTNVLHLYKIYPELFENLEPLAQCLRLTENINLFSLKNSRSLLSSDFTRKAKEYLSAFREHFQLDEKDSFSLAMRILQDPIYTLDIINSLMTNSSTKDVPSYVIKKILSHPKWLYGACIVARDYSYLLKFFPEENFVDSFFHKLSRVTILKKIQISKFYHFFLEENERAVTRGSLHFSPQALKIFLISFVRDNDDLDELYHLAKQLVALFESVEPDQDFYWNFIAKRTHNQELIIPEESMGAFANLLQLKSPQTFLYCFDNFFVGKGFSKDVILSNFNLLCDLIIHFCKQTHLLQKDHWQSAEIRISYTIICSSIFIPYNQPLFFNLIKSAFEFLFVNVTLENYEEVFNNSVSSLMLLIDMIKGLCASVAAKDNIYLFNDFLARIQYDFQEERSQKIYHFLLTIARDESPDLSRFVEMCCLQPNVNPIECGEAFKWLFELRQHAHVDQSELETVSSSTSLPRQAIESHLEFFVELYRTAIQQNLSPSFACVSQILYGFEEDVQLISHYYANPLIDKSTHPIWARPSEPPRVEALKELGCIGKPDLTKDASLQLLVAHWTHQFMHQPSITLTHS